MHLLEGAPKAIERLVKIGDLVRYAKSGKDLRMAKASGEPQHFWYTYGWPEKKREEFDNHVGVDKEKLEDNFHDPDAKTSSDKFRSVPKHALDRFMGNSKQTVKEAQKKVNLAKNAAFLAGMSRGSLRAPAAQEVQEAPTAHEVQEAPAAQEVQEAPATPATEGELTLAD